MKDLLILGLLFASTFPSIGLAEVFAPVQFNGTQPFAVSPDPRLELGPEATIELWAAAPVDLSAGPPLVTLLAHGEGPSVNYRIVLDRARKQVGIAIGTNPVILESADLSDGQYHHLAFLVRQGKIRFFLDGREPVKEGLIDARNLAGERAGFPLAPPSGRPLFMGGDPELPGFSGWIFCVRLWNKLLTPAEIEQVQKSYGPPPETDPLRQKLVAFSMFTDQQQELLFSNPEILLGARVGGETRGADILVPATNGQRISNVFVRADETRGVTAIIFEVIGTNGIPEFIPPRAGRNQADILTARNAAVAARDSNNATGFAASVRRIRTLELGVEDDSQSPAVGGFGVLRLGPDGQIASLSVTHQGRNLRSIRFGVRNPNAKVDEPAFRLSPIFGKPDLNAASARIPLLADLAGIALRTDGEGAPVMAGLAFQFPERPDEDALPITLSLSRWLRQDTGRPARVNPGRLDGTFSSHPAFRLEYDGRNLRLLKDTGEVQRFQPTQAGKTIWQGLDGASGVLLHPGGFELTTGVDTGAPAELHDRVTLVADDGTNRKFCAPNRFELFLMTSPLLGDAGCTFDLIRYSNGSFALLAENGKFIRFSRRGFLDAEGDSVDDSARFRLAPMPDGKSAMTGPNGKFLDVVRRSSPTPAPKPVDGIGEVIIDASFNDTLLPLSDTPKPFKLVPTVRRLPPASTRRFVAPQMYETGGEDKIEWGGTFSLEQRPTLAHANFRGYNVFLMNARDFQSDTGSYKMLFKYPAEDSRDYYTTDNKIIVPHGLLFKPENSADELSRTSTASNAVELTREWGMHLGGEVGVPELASFGLNFAFHSERQDRLKRELRTVNSRTVQTRYALVMDKSKIELDDEFYARVLQLRDEVLARDTPEPKVFRDFLLAFGTHYPYAVTYGGMAFLEIDYTAAELGEMQSAKVSLDGQAKATIEVISVGGNAGAESKLAVQTQRARTEERIRFGTYGGSATRGEGWSLPRGEEVPLFLDLRPIHELLNPVFFDDELIWTRVRAGVESAFRAYTDEAKQLIPTGQVTP